MVNQKVIYEILKDMDQDLNEHELDKKYKIKKGLNLEEIYIYMINEGLIENINITKKGEGHYSTIMKGIYINLTQKGRDYMNTYETSK